MRMRDSMRMRTSIVGMRKGVDMQMSVMTYNCIHDSKYRTYYHDNQRNKEDSGKFFPYQHIRKALPTMLFLTPFVTRFLRFNEQSNTLHVC